MPDPKLCALIASLIMLASAPLPDLPARAAPLQAHGAVAARADAQPIDARCSRVAWTALEPLGDRADEPVWAGSAHCRAESAILRGAVTTVALLWEADDRRLTWQGATWQTADGPVEMPPAQARARLVAGESTLRVQFEGVLGRGPGAVARGPAYVLAMRLDLPSAQAGEQTGDEP
jgi:hypothetical protein